MTGSSVFSGETKWINLGKTTSFLLRSKHLLGWTLLLVLATAFFTWLGYSLAIDFIDGLTGDFFLKAPDSVGILGWFKHAGWVVGKYAFLIVSRVAGFYLAFMAAYCLTTPGYVFLSASTEKLQAGEKFVEDAPFTVGGIIIDLIEGLKIGGLGLLVTLAALVANLIPGIGQVVVFLLYTYYSALMFVDYPTSRRRWTLREKIGWLNRHRLLSFRLGVLPALVSLIPILNIFFLAMLFPLLTVHTTLNFNLVESGIDNK
jgi:CysZ protein